MSANASSTDDRKMTSVFERYLTLWVLLCILAGIALASSPLAWPLPGRTGHPCRWRPGGVHPHRGLPVFHDVPHHGQIDFGTVIAAGKSGKPVFLTLFVNWCIKPFTMYGIALFFLGTLFYGFIGPEAVDYVKMPFGLDLPVGASHGAGTVMLVDGVKMLQIPLWRSYLAGCILLGIAPCTAMVLVWGFLARATTA